MAPPGQERHDALDVALDFSDDQLLVLENDHPLDHVLELADIAGPFVLQGTDDGADPRAAAAGRLYLRE